MRAFILRWLRFRCPARSGLPFPGAFCSGFLGGTIITVISATIGATLIYIAAKTALRDVLIKKAGAWIKKAEDEFQDHEVSFMLLMRLVPAIPFFAINLAAALLGVRMRTYVWTTLVGIIPGSGVYTWVGAGIDAVIARGETPNLGIIFEPNILGPILGLCVLAVLPVIIKKYRARASRSGS